MHWKTRTSALIDGQECGTIMPLPTEGGFAVSEQMIAVNESKFFGKDATSA
jgi:hypothetical protein